MHRGRIRATLYRSTTRPAHRQPCRQRQPNCRRFMRGGPRTPSSLAVKAGNWSGSTGHTPASKSKSLSESSHDDSAGISARFENRAQRPPRHVECICAHPSRRAINGKFRIAASYGDSLPALFFPCSVSKHPHIYRWCFAGGGSSSPDAWHFENILNAVSSQRADFAGARARAASSFTSSVVHKVCIINAPWIFVAPF